MRAVGGSMPNGTEDLFTVTESLQMFADDIGVEWRTVEDWRQTANRWPKVRRKEGVSFTVLRILASVADEDERWAAIEDAPFNPRNEARQWTPDGAKRVVGQRVERPVTVDEKVQAVVDLPRDDEVAAQVAAGLLTGPAVPEHVTPARDWSVPVTASWPRSAGWSPSCARRSSPTTSATTNVFSQHGEAHLNSSLITLMARRLTCKKPASGWGRSRSRRPEPVIGDASRAL